MIDREQASAARDTLMKFVEELHSFLQQMLNKPHNKEGKLLVLEGMSEELKAAWEGFNEDFSLARAHSMILEASPDGLQTHGLYGSQLRAKMSLFRIRMERFLAGFAAKPLIKLIDAADTLLDSLIAATGIDEALKELKDLLRNSIDVE